MDAQHGIAGKFFAELYCSHSVTQKQI